MKRRCFRCKKLEEESTVKFYKRTKNDPNATFFCKSCLKKGKNDLTVPHAGDFDVDDIKSFMESQVDEEFCDRSIVRFNYRLRKLKKLKNREFCDVMIREERGAIGKFYRNCPPGHEVDHVLPISKGGKHELSNLQYLTIEENRKKNAKTPKSDVPLRTTVFRGM